MSWKRPLFLLHRWAGIVLCLFFALWFASGIFMMYVEFPQLTQPERLTGSQALDFSTATLGPGEAVARLEPGDFAIRATPSSIESVAVRDGGIVAKSVRLAMVLERPAYVVRPDNDAQPRVVFADDGEVLRTVTPEMGGAVATAFVRRSGGNVSGIAFEGTVHTDQWSVSAALNDHRPLLRYALNDEDGTHLYVSSRTAEVVRDTHRTERVLNYFGAVTHWLYPTFIRKYPLVWEWMVDILSGAGVVLAVSGLWIGILRWNRRAAPGKPQVPYRGLMRWHYFSGILFGGVTVTWVFSGLLSMNPFNLNPPRRPESDQQLVYAGRVLTPTDFVLPQAGLGRDAVQAELIHYGGQPFYRVTQRDMSTRLVPGNSEAHNLPNAASMMNRAPELMADAKLLEATLLNDYDNYYYSRHPEHGEKPLPAIRVRFDDPRHTWFHLDPRTGQILDRSTRTNRVYRWLYNGLHSFDIWWLWQHRPLWDICVIAFSGGGMLLSLIGVVIGWRRLRYKAQRRAALAAYALAE